MESMSKSKHLMVSKKGKRKKPPKQKSKSKDANALMVGSRETNEEIWNDISSSLSRLSFLFWNFL